MTFLDPHPTLGASSPKWAGGPTKRMRPASMTTTAADRRHLVGQVGRDDHGPGGPLPRTRCAGGAAARDRARRSARRAPAGPGCRAAPRRSRPAGACRRTVSGSSGACRPSYRRGRAPGAPRRGAAAVVPFLEHGDVVDEIESREARVEPGVLREVAELAADRQAVPRSPDRDRTDARRHHQGRARWPASAAASSCRRRSARGVRRGQRPGGGDDGDSCGSEALDDTVVGDDGGIGVHRVLQFGRCRGAARARPRQRRSPRERRLHRGLVANPVGNGP